MNFGFTAEQDLLRDQARGFFTNVCGLESARSALDGDAEFDEELWHKVAGQGYPATVIPPEYGGLGLSYVELGVIAEELGRVLAPIPFSSSVYLATEALLLAGSSEQKRRWLPKLVSGEAIGTLAVNEGAGRISENAIKTGVTNQRLSGCKSPVVDGSVAHFAVVLSNQGLRLLDLGQNETSVAVLPTLDPSRNHASYEFRDALSEPLGAPEDGWKLYQRVLDRAAVLYAWEQVGGAEAALEMATEYAKGRFAFGRPIAGYQAIKHKAAQMHVKNTLAKSNCYYATWALDAGSSELPLAAAAARVSACRAFSYSAEENLHIHGGVGFTWEYDCHLYYRRAKQLALTAGSIGYWQDRLVSALEAQPIQES